MFCEPVVYDVTIDPTECRRSNAEASTVGGSLTQDAKNMFSNTLLDVRYHSDSNRNAMGRLIDCLYFEYKYMNPTAFLLRFEVL